MINITLKFDQPYKYLCVPDSGAYVRVKDDWQMAEWEYKPRAYTIDGWKQDINPDGGFPATVRCYPAGGVAYETIALTREWQLLWYQMLERACYNKIPDIHLKESWRHVTEHGRALTDNFAVQQGYADYILGLNLTAKPIRQKPLTMSGNILRVIGGDSAYYIVEALDLSGPAPGIDELWGKWWLVQWGTQSTIVKVGDGYRRTDFPQLNYGGVGYGVPFLLASQDGALRVPKAWCQPIEHGESYSPYYP